jgi:DNA (cytosine-5)-methyltransferase 1
VAINGKPTVISTFAGTGGSSLGYHWAGFKELLAIDFDAHAVECFKLNFPDVPVWKRSVVEVTGQEILDFCKIERGELDVFDGSPPCQGFSTAGKREVRDPRNDLFNHYWRLVDELQPKVFVMENVSGMAKGSMKGRFIEIMNTLKGGNYVVKCKQMNAMYYGVPQSRQRIIFLGVRKDLKKSPVFPKPSSQLISVKDALAQVKNVGFVPPITNAFMKSILHKFQPGENASKYHPKGSFFNNSRYPINKPAPTVTKMIPIGGVIHPFENRHISINEIKAICTFPENWNLGTKFGEAWARLGNAVMPKFMQAIATTIKEDILQ